MQFFIGLEGPSSAWPFLRCMISINEIRSRKSEFRINKWIMDSGAFTEISRHGKWRTEPEVYGDEINRWKNTGELVAAVTQDMMCEQFILDKTGMSIEQHQEITVRRYEKIKQCTDAYVMPVLQGFHPRDYVQHVKMYGDMLNHGQWVGVGSVCKRNSSPDSIEDVLLAIKACRPDLRLHGFGLKMTALGNSSVVSLLESSDSMAWSFAGRMEEGDAHDPRLALKYAAQVEKLINRPVFIQPQLLQWWS